jgi:SAM-dependent methyltransferase
MTARFYDELAPYYHLLYGDWSSAIGSQGAALAALLAAEGIERGAPVLDAACGIGTQTLGLLTLGYQVTASDISAGAVHRLKDELSLRKLSATTRVDDLRTLALCVPGSMAAVLACDNSIPHLLSDEEILQAFRSCHRSLRPNGVVVISVRDYAVIDRKNPDVRPYGLRRDGDGCRFLAVQAWEWEGDQYDVRLYLTKESPDGSCGTQVILSRYYAVSIARLVQLMEDAGFAEVRRLDDVLFQPVLIGRRMNSQPLFGGQPAD